MAPPGGPGAPGAPAAAPEPPAPPKRTIELNRPEITTTRKMRKFMWRRVVIDKETGKVAAENLQGLDPNWEDKEVIWTQIEEYTGIS